MEQMYDIVAEVDHYKEFVPWCTNSTVFDVRPGHCKAMMEIGFPPLVERYTCNITLSRPRLVRVSVRIPLSSIPPLPPTSSNYHHFLVSFQPCQPPHAKVCNLFNPLGPRPATALSLRIPMRREVTVSNDLGIQL